MGQQVVGMVAPLKVNIAFECKHTWEDGEQESWKGKITEILDFGSHVQFRISSRSGFTVICGKSMNGNFMAIPTYEAGFDLADPTDLFYNKEKVLRSCGEGGHCNAVDGITAVYALRALAEAGKFPE